MASNGGGFRLWHFPDCFLEVSKPCEDIVKRGYLSKEHNLHALVVSAKEVKPIMGRKELERGWNGKVVSRPCSRIESYLVLDNPSQQF